MNQRSKRRTSSEWLEWVERWEASAQSAKTFAARHGLHPKTLTWWRSELRKRGRAQRKRIKDQAPARGPGRRRTSGFTEVRLVPSSQVEHSGAIEIALPGGAVIRLRRGDVDPSLLTRVIDVLSRC